MSIPVGDVCTEGQNSRIDIKERLMKNGNNKKILFIELDGATWNILNPLMGQGKLPNLKSLIKRGVSSGMDSEPPYISPKIWTSIFTGKTPEKHGVTFFGATSQMLNSKRIWNILSEKGHKVGVLGSLVTWPPSPINGFMIPSVDAIGPDTYPEDYRFFQEIALNERRKSKQLGNKSHLFRDMIFYTKKLWSNGVSSETFRHLFRYLVLEKLKMFNHMDRYWRKATLYLELSTELFVNLYKSYKPDFATLHIHLCDSLSHRYWMFYEPDKFPDVDAKDVARYKDVIPNSYMAADKAIGKILSSLDKDTTVVVVSDHGSKALDGDRGTYDINIDKFLDVLKINNKVVVARFGPGIYVHFQDKELMQKTQKTIEGISMGEYGEKIFYVKSHGEMLVVTKAVWKVKAEDINEDSPINIPGLSGYKARDLFSRQATKMSGVHDKEGIFIMAGPDFKVGAKPRDPRIYDITPTVLSIMGYPVAKDMDGRVLSEIFTDEFLAENLVEFIESYEDSTVKEKKLEELDYDKIKVRLEGLGYL